VARFVFVVGAGASASAAFLAGPKGLAAALQRVENNEHSCEQRQNEQGRACQNHQFTGLRLVTVGCHAAPDGSNGANSLVREVSAIQYGLSFDEANTNSTGRRVVRVYG
jgi:hypothetical protein